ncbi:LuxR C-terminal-related transcriptional regulator [Microbacterium suaedae]|uniref:LuxR C-terminal-related transcriptional regulator n=1 Tax=Microbacterium suaedae TaxID=2067813 RepID=UPI000DA26162|nr:LuxR C-terminal-related transcriptional regulator [Microbacterium suaedae]
MTSSFESGRPRLLALMQQAHPGETVLIRAPDGSGTTTFLTSWLAATGLSAAWLSRHAPDDKEDTDVIVLTLADATDQDADLIVRCRERAPHAILVVVSPLGWPGSASARGVRPDFRVGGWTLSFTRAELVSLAAAAGVNMTDLQATRIIAATAGFPAAVDAIIAEGSITGELSDAQIRRGCDSAVARLASKVEGDEVRLWEWRAAIATAHLAPLSRSAVDALWSHSDRTTAFETTLIEAGFLRADSEGRLAFIPGMADAFRRSVPLHDDPHTREHASASISALALPDEIEDAVRISAISPHVRARLLAIRWRDLARIPVARIRGPLETSLRVSEDPRLRIALARTLIDIGHCGHNGHVPDADLAQAEELLDHVADLSSGMAPEDAAIFVTMRAAASRLRGRQEASLQQLRALASVLPPDEDRATISFHTGLSALESSHIDEAMLAFESAQTAAAMQGLEELAAMAAELTTVAAYISHDASAHLSLRPSPRPSHRRLSAAAKQIGFSLNRLDVAAVQRILGQVANYTIDDPRTIPLVEAGLRALAHGVLGRPRAAQSEIEHFETQVALERMSPGQTRWLHAIRAEALLANGCPREALEELDRGQLDIDAFPHAELQRALAFIRLGEHTEAIARSERVLELAHGRSVRLAMRGQVLLHMARRESGDRSGALSPLEDALRVASQTQRILPFGQQGPAWLASVLDDADTLCADPAIAKVVHTLHAVAADIDGSGELIELTEREIVVLEVLASQATIAVAAERLGVSPNTIKTQLRSIYRKLGTSTRADAILAARSAGLIA